MKFNQIKYHLVHVLGDLKVMGKSVDVLTEFPPGMHLPAITMNSNGGRGHTETLVYNNMNPLPCDHPYFNPQTPETLYVTEEVIKYVFDGKLLLHVWAESNEERDILVEKVIDKILNDKNKNFGSDLRVQIRNIGATNDIDQFDSFPPLFHTTMEIDYIHETIQSTEVYPLCRIEKRE